MNYKLVELEEIRVIGIKYELANSLSKNTELAKKYWHDFNAKLKENKLYLGANWCKYAFVERINHKIYYYIAIPQKEYALNCFTAKRFESKKYLVVQHTGNMNQLKDTINHIYQEIIPNHKIIVDNHNFIYFEKYDHKFHWNRPDSIIEIYIPIK